MTTLILSSYPKSKETHACLHYVSQSSIYSKSVHDDVGSVCKTQSRIHVTQETLPGTVCLQMCASVSMWPVKSVDYRQSMKKRGENVRKAKSKNQRMQADERDKREK